MYRLAISCTSQTEAERTADLLESIEAAFATGWQELDEQKSLFEAEAYFHEMPEPQLLEPLKGRQFRLHAVEEKNWVDQSLQQFTPVRAGRFFVHGSHHAPSQAPGAIAIRIDAGLAFGTGHHATTAGCLLALDNLLKRETPRRMLDLGCGTGVLAIAAARAIRRTVIASDIDPVAVATAKDNAGLNGVTGLVRPVIAAGFDHPALSRGEPFDLIMANILANPLMAMANDLGGRLSAGGHAILSGILAVQAPRVEARYRAAGLRLAARQIDGDWAVLTLYRPLRPHSSAQ